jgi:hypothetical protein
MTKPRATRPTLLTDMQGLTMAPETSRMLWAGHEAAHAVVAHAQGVPLPTVTIDEAELYRLVRCTRYAKGTLRENARISIAGWLENHRYEKGFEERLGGHFAFSHDEADDDEGHFKVWTLAAAGGDVGQAQASIAGLIAETEAILAARDVAGRVLGDALAEAGRLEAVKVLAILGPYPEVSPETLIEREAVLAKSGRLLSSST